MTRTCLQVHRNVLPLTRAGNDKVGTTAMPTAICLSSRAVLAQNIPHHDIQLTFARSRRFVQPATDNSLSLSPPPPLPHTLSLSLSLSVGLSHTRSLCLCLSVSVCLCLSLYVAVLRMGSSSKNNNNKKTQSTHTFVLP